VGGTASRAIPEREAPWLRVEARGRGLALQEVCGLLHAPRLEGKVDFDFDPLEMGRGTLSAREPASRPPGAQQSEGIVVKALGGRISFSDFTMEDLGGAAPVLRSTSGEIDGIQLAALGEALGFGVMSGVVRGKFGKLSVRGGRLESFVLDVETVPVSGIPQYLNRQAIESIRRVLSGPFGAIEESLFSKFYYEYGGFQARLTDGILWLEGKYSEDETEYLLYGSWYQFPRINIVNSRPGEPYDWISILANFQDARRK
jgi:hypothetical protein